MSAAVDGTGYLSREDDRLFDAHLYIAAMGRSCSTYLANLLATPPKRWVMVELWFVNGLLDRRRHPRQAGDIRYRRLGLPCHRLSLPIVA